MIGYFAEVAPDGRYIQCIAVELPTDALILPTDPANTVHPVTAPPAWGNGTPTKVLHFIEGAEKWVETATLDQLKEAKQAEITRARIATDSDRFVYQGLSIRTADKDMFDMLIADARISKGQGMPPNWPGGWKAIENSYVLISTVAEWNTFFIAMYDAGINNFNHSQQLKARISAATTPEQVAAISWDMDA